MSVNPGIRQLSSRGGIVLERLTDIDLLIMNKIEAAELVPAIAAGIGSSESWPTCGSEFPACSLERQNFSSGGYDISLGAFFRGLLSRGQRYAVGLSSRMQ